MAGRVSILTLWICLLFVTPGKCNESLSEIIEKLENFEDTLADLKLDVAHIENKMSKKLKRVKSSLRAQIRRNMKQQTGIKNTKGLMSCSKCLESSQIASTLTEYDDEISELKKRVNSLEALRHEHKEQRNSGVSLETIAASTSASLSGTSMTTPTAPSPTFASDTFASLFGRDTFVIDRFGRDTFVIDRFGREISIPIWSAFNYPKHGAVQGSIEASTSAFRTASLTEVPFTRILVFQRYSDVPLQIEQMDISSTIVSNYSALKVSHLGDVIYVSKINSILFAPTEPKQLLSSRLDSSVTEILRDGVKVNKMAVDEERDLIFFSSDLPTKSIQRMGLNGKNLGTLYQIKKPLFSMAVYPRTETIYASSSGLYALSYDGNSAVTVVEGGLVFGLTLDKSREILYFTSFGVIFRHSISLKTTTEVVKTSSNFVTNMIYHRDMLYYSSGRTATLIETFDLVRETHGTPAETKKYTGLLTLICLVPRKRVFALIALADPDWPNT